MATEANGYRSRLGELAKRKRAVGLDFPNPYMLSRSSHFSRVVVNPGGAGKNLALPGFAVVGPTR